MQDEEHLKPDSIKRLTFSIFLRVNRQNTCARQAASKARHPSAFSIASAWMLYSKG